MRPIAFLFLVASIAIPALAAAQVPCLAGTAPGLDPADVETAAQLVCSQLRRQGESVSDPVSTAEGTHWRVNLRPLGRKVLLSLQYVGQTGAV